MRQKKTADNFGIIAAVLCFEGFEEGCRDPAGAVMDLIGCFESEDAACASAAYDPGFELFHNTVPDDQGLARTYSQKR